jgi:hypothetical protein
MERQYAGVRPGRQERIAIACGNAEEELRKNAGNPQNFKREGNLSQPFVLIHSEFEACDRGSRIFQML